jgi:superfamily I DNA/RNA helicase
MHSSKGLEFGLVPIPSLGDMPKKGEDEADAARVLYVAMTRVIDRLVMTYREPSSSTRKIQDSIGSVRQHLDEMDSQKAAG